MPRRAVFDPLDTNSGAANCTPSSIRFKENVTQLSPGYALDELSKLNVVGFDYKEKQAYETNHSYGLIAEDVEKIDKNLVDFGYDGQSVPILDLGGVVEWKVVNAAFELAPDLLKEDCGRVVAAGDPA